MRQPIGISLLVIMALSGCGSTAPTRPAPLSSTTGYMQTSTSQTSMTSTPAAYETAPPVATMPTTSEPSPSPNHGAAAASHSANANADHIEDAAPQAQLPTLAETPAPVSLTPPTMAEPKQSFLGKVVDGAKSMYQSIKDRLTRKKSA